ncbi:TetR family transcriptional regulator [Rhodopirellula maiorica SM1]|uniref:TetR family transcriptional regulator n=1 Tax=Rhodopirellula maiorica SM1 TaxID=1265738 RepID=M5S3E3_9BACT|nr:TetR/AcrR family transcriptional regulator [Rhodopirellula maiorica]EMI22152.1 TetR family transcriptional regulator [Rhodopirellula maiorica SM1]
MTWERARKPEQKAVRRDAILTAARELFSELDYEEISLNGIAREAGFSKPNVYRYFSTREEIFLVIFEEEQGKFVDALIARLNRIRAKDPANAIAKGWVEVALKHRVWLDLLPQLSTSLEKNSSVQQLVDFKKAGYERFAELIETLHRVCPTINQTAWGSVIQCGYALMAGLWSHANPGANVVEALQHPDVDRPLCDFAGTLQSGLSALIRGSEIQPHER